MNALDGVAGASAEPEGLRRGMTAPDIGSGGRSDERGGRAASKPEPEGAHPEMLRERCANDNHGRAMVTVRFCPNCGEVVNRKILATGCTGEKHALSRRRRNAFCVDCGDGLLQGRAGR